MSSTSLLVLMTLGIVLLATPSACLKRVAAQTLLSGGEGIIYGNYTSKPFGPGSRQDGGAWAGIKGLYIFGGDGYPASGGPLVESPHELGDVWFYEVAQNDWQLVQGNGSGHQPLVLDGDGTTFSSANRPGARQDFATWSLGDSIAVIFGGGGNNVKFNDVWQFRPAGGLMGSGAQWRLLHSNPWVHRAPPTYDGPREALTPGWRQNAFTWVSASKPQLLFLFGGETINNQIMGDVWVFDLRDLRWSFVGGLKGAGMQAPTDTFPGARESGVSLAYGSGAYIFGGRNALATAYTSVYFYDEYLHSFRLVPTAAFPGDNEWTSFVGWSDGDDAFLTGRHAEIWQFSFCNETLQRETANTGHGDIVDARVMLFGANTPSQRPFIFGGKRGSQLLNAVYEFSYTAEQPSNCPVSAAVVLPQTISGTYQVTTASSAPGQLTLGGDGRIVVAQGGRLDLADATLVLNVTAFTDALIEVVTGNTTGTFADVEISLTTGSMSERSCVVVTATPQYITGVGVFLTLAQDDSGCGALTPQIIGAIVGGVLALAVVVALVGICLFRRKGAAFSNKLHQLSGKLNDPL